LIFELIHKIIMQKSVSSFVKYVKHSGSFLFFITYECLHTYSYDLNRIEFHYTKNMNKTTRSFYVWGAQY